jgi:hypothetical protein
MKRIGYAIICLAFFALGVVVGCVIIISLIEHNMLNC